MGKRDKLTLTSVLASFEESLVKAAAESTSTGEGAAQAVASGTPTDVVTDTEKQTKTEAGDTDDAVADAESTVSLPGDADDAVAKAEGTKEASDVVSGLKSIAKTASENSAYRMEKEAQEFGKLFAHSVIAEFQKVADEQDAIAKVASEAYEATENSLFTEKLAQIFDEAYNIATSRLISAESYEKTAALVSATDKNTEAIQMAANIEQAKGIIKNAYDLTQQVLDGNK